MNDDLTQVPPTTVTIPAGQTQAIVQVVPESDGIIEGPETLTLTGSIASGDADTDITINPAAVAATVTISDADSATLSVIASEPDATEPSTDGEFTFSLSAPSAIDTTFSYDVGGTADAGDDFETLSGLITIPAGSTSVSVIVDVVDDDSVERDETVIVNIDPITINNTSIVADPESSSATVTIVSEDTATIYFNLLRTVGETDDGTVREGGQTNGQFIVELSDPVDFGVQVGYRISSSFRDSGSADNPDDYQAINGLVFFSAGVTQIPIDIIVKDDSLSEGTEFVELVLTDILTPAPGSAQADEVSIIETPNASRSDVEVVFIGDNENGDNAPEIVADNATFTVNENSSNGSMVGTVTAGGPDQTGDLTYAITGGTGQTAYSINAGTGQILVADSNQLDFETSPSFDLQVSATDEAGLTDTATITINLVDRVEDDSEPSGPQATDLIFDSTEWESIFRDFVDGGFNDGIADGYRLSSATEGTSIPWVNIDIIKVQFDSDVGESLDTEDFVLAGMNGFDRESNAGNVPMIESVTFDSMTNVATLNLDGVIGPNAFTLTLVGTGIDDGTKTMSDSLITDFIVLPGDTVDSSDTAPNNLYIVNDQDSQFAINHQTGFLSDSDGDNETDGGQFRYDLRADLDGSGDVLGNDATLASDRVGSFVSPPTASESDVQFRTLDPVDEEASSLALFEEATDQFFAGLSE